MLLPFLIASLVTLAANGLVFTRTIRSWYELPGSPGFRVRERVNVNDDRLLNFDLHFNITLVDILIPFTPPPGSNYVEEVEAFTVAYTVPDPDGVALVAILWPTSALLVVMVAWWLLQQISAGFARWYGTRLKREVFSTGTSLFATTYCVSCSMVVIGAFMDALGLMTGSEVAGGIFILAPYLAESVFLICGTWTMVTLLGGAVPRIVGRSLWHMAFAGMLWLALCGAVFGSMVQILQLV